MSNLHASKTAIVTGGAAGLGLAIVQAFLSEGANVIATDINDAALQALPDAVDAAHKDRLVPYKCDSADDEAVQKMVVDAVARFGRVDVLVNNAGVNDNMDPTGVCSRAMWDRNLLVNLTGPFITSQHTINQFLKQEPASGDAAGVGTRGVIVNVISAAGQNGWRAGVAYTASKHGAVGLTKNTAAFYGPRGIRCVAIMPGPMRTNMARNHDISKYHPEGLQLGEFLIPFSNLGLFLFLFFLPFSSVICLFLSFFLALSFPSCLKKGGKKKIEK